VILLAIALVPKFTYEEETKRVSAVGSDGVNTRMHCSDMLHQTANSGFSEKKLYNCFAGRRLVNVESWASLMNFVVVQGG
jgi:hypothetical protein